MVKAAAGPPPQDPGSQGAGHGFLTLEGFEWKSELYVTLSVFRIMCKEIRIICNGNISYM